MRSQGRPATQPQHDDTRYQHHARIHFSNEADPAKVYFVMMGSFREMPPVILHAAGPRMWEAR